MSAVSACGSSPIASAKSSACMSASLRGGVEWDACWPKTSWAGRKSGYTRLLLDTLPSMKEARSMYVSGGFKPTAPDRFNPIPGTAFLELALQ